MSRFIPEVISLFQKTLDFFELSQRLEFKKSDSFENKLQKGFKFVSFYVPIKTSILSFSSSKPKPKPIAQILKNLNLCFRKLFMNLFRERALELQLKSHLIFKRSLIEPILNAMTISQFLKDKTKNRKNIQFIRHSFNTIPTKEYLSANRFFFFNEREKNLFIKGTVNLIFFFICMSEP